MLSEEINHVAAEVSAILRVSLAADCSPLYRAAYHLPSQGGKRMRPFLVAKSSELVAGLPSRSCPPRLPSSFSTTSRSFTTT
jgi:geranylgeranyl pyrophosphate synthase